MTRILVLFAMIGVVVLSGCNGQIPIPRETITFVYKFAEQRQPDRYHVQVLRGPLDSPDCYDEAAGVSNEVEDIMRLDQLAVVIQRLGDPSLVNACHDRFSVDVATMRAVDDDFAKFEFYPLANSSDRRGQLIANLALSGNTFPRPSKIQIEINGAVIEGLKATDGVAEINFGASGPIYRCEGRAGEVFWDEHIRNPATDTFLEFTLTSYDPSTHGMGARFQCLARNVSDPSDNRLLLIMLGSVFITANN